MFSVNIYLNIFFFCNFKYIYDGFNEFIIILKINDTTYVGGHRFSHQYHTRIMQSMFDIWKIQNYFVSLYCFRIDSESLRLKLVIGTYLSHQCWELDKRYPRLNALFFVNISLIKFCGHISVFPVKWKLKYHERYMDWYIIHGGIWQY